MLYSHIVAYVLHTHPTFKVTPRELPLHMHPPLHLSRSFPSLVVKWRDDGKAVSGHLRFPNLVSKQDWNTQITKNIGSVYILAQFRDLTREFAESDITELCTLPLLYLNALQSHERASANSPGFSLGKTRHWNMYCIYSVSPKRL